LPAILLGSVGEFAAYSYFHLFKKITDVLHKFVPSFYKSIFPYLVRKSQGQNFDRQWVKGNIVYHSGVFVVALALTLLAPFIFRIFFNQESLQDSRMVAFHFGLFLLLGAWIQTNSYTALLKENSWLILGSTIVRASFWSALLYFGRNELTSENLAMYSWLSVVPSALIYSVGVVFIDKKMLKPQVLYALEFITFAGILSLISST
jgi:hypothetical protein